MNKIVNIVVDASGSMAEDDKNGVVKYLLNGINNIIEYKVQLKDLSTNIITIFIGLDANRAILKDIATENVVYSVTDFVQVIFDACS